jgi:UPF0716 protein FxsA
MKRFFSKIIISPFWRLALLLVLTPILELFILHFLLGVGVWFTLLCMILSGLLGVFIARREGIRHWTLLHQQLDRGENPTVHIFNIFLIHCGVFFMILPGLLTSLFGLFLLFPFTRFFVASHLVLQFEAFRLQSRKAESPLPEVIDIN